MSKAPKELLDALASVDKHRTLTRQEKRELVEKQVASIAVQPLSHDTIEQMRRLMAMEPKVVLNSIVYAEWIRFHHKTLLSMLKKENPDD